MSLRTAFLIVVAVSALTFGALFSLPVARKSFARVTVKDVSLAVELADDPQAKVKGLAGRTTLARFAGMLFRFDEPDRYAIWMKGMRFPIDILWLREGKVVDLEEYVLPPQPGVGDSFLPVYRPDVAADAVLEVRAGFSREQKVKIGDQVEVAIPGGEFARAEVLPESEYAIEYQRTQRPQGKNFRIERLLEKNEVYQKFLISYASGELTVTGVMNVPLGTPPEGGFPLLILNHGWISPEIYTTGRGSKREQDFFARREYVTIHPDLRGFAGSSPNLASHHDFFSGYTEDVVNLISSLQALRSPLLDLSRIGVWGHSMGGGIGARVSVLVPEIRAFVLFAPNSAAVEDNFYELPAEEVAWLRERYGPEGAESYRKISPLSYFDLVSAPIQFHHGTEDSAVPKEFSEKMFQALVERGKRAELFLYPGEQHEFADAWQLAAERSLQFFNRYVKAAR